MFILVCICSVLIYVFENMKEVSLQGWFYVFASKTVRHYVIHDNSYNTSYICNVYMYYIVAYIKYCQIENKVVILKHEILGIYPLFDINNNLYYSQTRFIDFCNTIYFLLVCCLYKCIYNICNNGVLHNILTTMIICWWATRPFRVELELLLLLLWLN